MVFSSLVLSLFSHSIQSTFPFLSHFSFSVRSACCVLPFLLHLRVYTRARMHAARTCNRSSQTANVYTHTRTLYISYAHTHTHTHIYLLYYTIFFHTLLSIFIAHVRIKKNICTEKRGQRGDSRSNDRVIVQ